MQYISPRRLARAAGVSESSVKRWCDQGLITTVKTAGGHRRVSVEAAAEFLRRAGFEAARPELLGLPPRSKLALNPLTQLADDFVAGLQQGDEARCRQIVLDLHLSGMRASRILDTVVAEAFHRIGADWEGHRIDVYQERRACGIALRVFDEWRGLMPAAPATAPLAIGGAPDEDPYALPTAMVELVLRQVGWRSQSLGAQLPFASMSAAVRDLQPRLCWLSISNTGPLRQFVEQYRAFYQEWGARVAIVVGGRALTESVRRQLEYAAYCDNLQHLESFARTLWNPASTSASSEGGVEGRRGPRVPKRVN